MKKNMEDIDKLIKETLTQEEAAFYDELEEQNLFDKIGGIFKGKLGWLVLIMNIFSLIVTALTVYCVVEFFKTDNTNEMIKWSLGILFGALFTSMIKLYGWMEMNKNDILREFKRLELQLSILNKKTEK